MALIPPSFFDTVVAIGTTDSSGRNGWIGTGFIFGYMHTRSEEGKTYTCYLVTNKHVIKDRSSILLKFNPKTDQAATDFNIPLYDVSSGMPLFTGHVNANIDIAILEIDPIFLQTQGMKFDFFRSDENVKCINEMRDLITEGDFVYVLGFPMGILDKDRQYVFLRQGAISRIRDLYEGRSIDFVIDATVFPGNSGGPVILKPELSYIVGTKAPNSADLIGIITSYIPYSDTAISAQTGRPRITFEENSGLSVVLPTDYILETIEVDREKKKGSTLYKSEKE